MIWYISKKIEAQQTAHIFGSETNTSRTVEDRVPFLPSGYDFIDLASLCTENKKLELSPNIGLEPLTLRLKVWCSTNWANRAAHTNEVTNDGTLSWCGVHYWYYRDTNTCISCGLQILITPRFPVGLSPYLAPCTILSSGLLYAVF